MDRKLFQFKQFSVDQSGCAMKINTDGVLLGAITEAPSPQHVLDIGTGTGVIALMLAQKFTGAKIDAVEIDSDAAQTATRNFKNSSFTDRLTLYSASFENYFSQHPEKKYELIVSNPPFYIDSLKSPWAKKALAKHTDNDFFERLIKSVLAHLTPHGCFWMIIPVSLKEIIDNFAVDSGVFPQKVIDVKSYPQSNAHRVIISFGFQKIAAQISNFTIYETAGIYSQTYQKLLQPYFLAF